MKIEYDPVRDLLYLYFSSPDTKAAETGTIKPGVNVDFDKNDHCPNYFGRKKLKPLCILRPVV